jgi:hypothetical protein
MNGISGISFEDTQALLHQLQTFQGTLDGDWQNVVGRWQNLQSCWRDRQYEKFEPFFEDLNSTYDQFRQQNEEYTQFLNERIQSSEDAMSIINL